MAEGLRYSDLMRWACGERLNEPKLGFVPNLASGYTQEELDILNEQLGFVDGALDVYTKRVTNPVPNFISPKNYLFSIPTDEIGLNPNLVQNPGWEL